MSLMLTESYIFPFSSSIIWYLIKTYIRLKSHYNCHVLVLLSSGFTSCHISPSQLRHNSEIKIIADVKPWEQFFTLLPSRGYRCEGDNRTGLNLPQTGPGSGAACWAVVVGGCSKTQQHICVKSPSFPRPPPHTATPPPAVVKIKLFLPSPFPYLTSCFNDLYLFNCLTTTPAILSFLFVCVFFLILWPPCRPPLK